MAAQPALKVFRKGIIGIIPNIGALTIWTTPLLEIRPAGYLIQLFVMKLFVFFFSHNNDFLS